MVQETQYKFLELLDLLTLGHFRLDLEDYFYILLVVLYILLPYRLTTLELQIHKYPLQVYYFLYSIVSVHHYLC